MRQLVRVIYWIGILALIVLLGFFGVSLLFSDFGPDAPPWQRTLIIGWFYFLSGIGVGFITRSGRISAAIGWSALLLGAAAFWGAIGSLRDMFVSLSMFAPICIAAGGGYFGRWLRRKRQEEKELKKRETKEAV